MGINMKKKVKIGNEGFSLVELVIIMAIIVILGGVTAIGLSLVTSRPVDECAKKIQVALEGNRNTTMGKFSASIVFTADSSGVYMEEYINGSSDGKVQIGQSGVSVSYVTTQVGASVTTTTDLSGSSVELSFDRASGSLKSQGDGTTYVTSFIVSRGDRVLTVTIDRLTGRIDVE